MKYWDKMKENEWTDPKYWKDLIEDDAELKEVKFRGGAKSRFIGEYKEWLSDNKPISMNKRKLLKQKEKYNLLTIKEMRLLKTVCFERITWQKYEEEQADAVKA